ncbi:unnamed protein product [Ectocarpus sp. 12 AP-2014]
MGKQPTTFRIQGAASAVNHVDVEWFFDNFGVPLKYAFAAIGIPESTTILINLKNKATLASVEKTLKRDLGTQYTAEAVGRAESGQRFVPGERQKKDRCKATIEIEAAAAAAASLHGDSTAIKFVLVGVSQRTTSSYNKQAGLVKEAGNEERTARPLEKGNPVPAGEQAGVAPGLGAPHHQGRTVDVIGAAAPTPATTRLRPESKGLLKSTMHEASEPERWQIPFDTTSTRPPSVRHFAPVMNEDWEEARVETDGKEARQIQRGVFSICFFSPHAGDCALLSFVGQGGRNVMEREHLSHQVQVDTITAVRQILSTGRDPSIHVPKLVEFVENENDSALQIESVGLLATISGSHTNVVVENGAVPIFVRLLTCANDDIREEAVRAVGNIAGDSPFSRDMVLQRGSLGPLLEQLTDRSKPSMLRIATWALKRFCGEISPPRLEQISPALPTLARLIRSVDEEVLRNACAALRYLCAPGLDADFLAGIGARMRREIIQVVVGTGFCQRLVELLYHASPAVHLEVLWAMNGIVSSEDQHTQELINSNVLPRLHHLLSSSHHQELREKTCQVICRITTGREEQIQAVIEAGIIPTLIQFLANVNSDIRRYAASAISNVTEFVEPGEVKGWMPLLFILLENDTQGILRVSEILETFLKYAASAISNVAEFGEPEEVKGWIPLLFILLENETQGILRVFGILEKFLKVVPDSDAWLRLRDLLSSSDPKVRYKTCEVIHKVTRCNTEQSRVAIEAGIVPDLIQCVANGNRDIPRNTASVSNVTEEDEPEEVRGCIPVLLALLEIDDTQVIIGALEILGITLQAVPDSDAWRRLCHLLSSSNADVRYKACEVTRWITTVNNEQARAVVEAGIVPVLIKQLADRDSGIQRHAASAISNVIELGDSEEIRRWVSLLLSLLGNCGTISIAWLSWILQKFLKVVPDSDAWRRLLDLLSSSNTEVREKTCQVIHKVTRWNKEQTRAAIEAGVVPTVIQLLDDVNYGIRLVCKLFAAHLPLCAASVFSNATKFGEPEEVRGWIPFLFILLESFSTAEVDVNVLEIIERILECGDTDAKAQGQEMNQMATCMTECGGWMDLERFERLSQSESVDGLGFFDINLSKVRRSLTRLFVHAMYLMFNFIC